MKLLNMVKIQAYLKKTIHAFLPYYTMISKMLVLWDQISLVLEGLKQ